MTYIVTAHQPNLLPGMSVISKIEASHAVIWLDEVQFSKGGWTNRNKAADKTWLTVPVEAHCVYKPINRVRIGEPKKEWRWDFIHKLIESYPGPLTQRVCEEILRPYRLLVGLNVALLRIVCPPNPAWHFQSHLDGGHAVVSQSTDADELLPISHRLAMMVDEVGGTIYLSGPSGRHYLDERPFHELGIEVDYWAHSGPNPCVLASEANAKIGV